MNSSPDKVRKEECGQRNEILKGRTKTKVACEFCRRRKIKCNGENPCSNCVNGGREGCTYARRIEEKKTPRRYSCSAKTMQLLTKRISCLESVLTKIASKFEETGEVEVRKDENMNTQVKAPVELTNQETWSSLLKNSSLGFKSKTAQGFKSASIFCIFSKESIGWMEKTFANRDEELIILMKKIPLVFEEVLDFLTQIWLNANQGNMIGHTPIPDSPVVFQILEAYYENIHFAEYICDLSHVRDIFVRYYNQSQGGCVKLGYSELLIMNITLALCLIDVQFDNDSSNKDTIVEPFSEQHVFDLKEMLFSNAIFFYEKILVISEGIASIQAIFLLVLYIEVSHISDFPINYMLSSVAIRYAQEMGLHRYESFEHLPENEVELRRRLWRYCHHNDIECSYKYGKPPLINTSSVSTLTENDSDIFSVSIDPFTTGKKMKTLNDRLITECLTKGIQAYYSYFFLMLSRIRLRSYELLFSVKAQKELLRSKDMVFETIQSINEEMFLMAQMMEPEVRPTLRYAQRKETNKNHNFQPLYDADSSFYKENTLYFQLLFYSHLIFINRIPFLIDAYENDPVAVTLGNLGLDAARSAMKLILTLDKNTSHSYLNGLMFYAFLAFSCLTVHCLNFPNNPESHNDCLLLIEMSRKYFARKHSTLSEVWAHRRKYDHKTTVADLAVRVLLRLLINVISIESGRNYVEEIDGLDEHLKQCRLIYPELFNKEPEQGLEENNAMYKLIRLFDPLLYSFHENSAKPGYDFAADLKPQSPKPNNGQPLDYRRFSLDNILNNSESYCGRP